MQKWALMGSCECSLHYRQIPYCQASESGDDAAVEKPPTLELKLLSRLLQSQHPPRHSAPDPWECCSFGNMLEVRLALPGAFGDMGL